jgi:hypothetical protein
MAHLEETHEDSMVTEVTKDTEVTDRGPIPTCPIGQQSPLYH